MDTRGYWEEYINDLTSRDMLDEVMRALPAGDATLIEQAYQPSSALIGHIAAILPSSPGSVARR